MTFGVWIIHRLENFSYHEKYVHIQSGSYNQANFTDPHYKERVELVEATGDALTIMTFSLLFQAIIYTPGWPPFDNILLLTYVEFRVQSVPNLFFGLSWEKNYITK